MMADKKFSQFTDGSEMMVGDQPVGLRPSSPTENFIFDFPGLGIRDSNGNYLFEYATVGALAVNHLKFVSSVSTLPALLTADGTDSNIGISIQPKGTAQIILDELTWPASDGAAGTFMATDGAGNLFFTGGVATAIIGTANQVLANGTSGVSQTGSVTLTTPQDIAITSSPTFDNLKLTGANILDTNGNNILNFVPTALAANYISIKNQAAGSAPEIDSLGGDTNIGIIYRTKATGAHQFISTNTTIPMIWQSGTTSQHTTSWSIPNTAASRTITLQDASGTMAYLADITANGTVNAGTINQIAYYAATGTVISGLAGGNGTILVTGSTGIPSMLANPAATGKVLQSVSGDAPAYSTATYPSIATGTGTILRANGTNWLASTATFADTYAVSTLLFASASNVVTGLPTANSAMLYTSVTGIPAWSASMTNGQIMIGSTGASPAPATLTAGPGISIANGANSITISGTGSGIGWTEVPGTSQAMTADNGYVANNGGLVTLTLPVTAAFGTAINVMGKGAGGWIIAQNGGQNIQIGSVSSSVGAGGSVASTNRFDSISLICTTADTTWSILGGGQTAGFTIV